MGFYLPQNCSQGPKQRTFQRNYWANEASTTPTGLIGRGQSHAASMSTSPVRRAGQESQGVWVDWAVQVPGCLTSLKPTEERGLREFLVRLEVTSRRGDGMSFPDWACAKRSTSQKHSDAPVHMNALQVIGGVLKSWGRAYHFPFRPRISQGLGIYLNKRV